MSFVNPFGTEACACLDTSRRRFAPPRDAELCADPLAQASAFTLGGFLEL